MDQYSSSYVSVIPRIVPSEYSSKKIPMIDQVNNQSLDKNSLIRYTSPTTTILNRSVNNRPLSTRLKIINNNQTTNKQESPSLNQSFILNNLENSSNDRTKTGIYHEPLKDNSGDNIISRNSYSKSSYPNSYDYGLYENLKINSNKDNKNDRIYSYGYIIIIIEIIIAFISLTALAISIYLLVKINNS
ncbi:unnamed protein product [Rotaria sp. Silwood1]|nr:unnamed protein product [Rotaria sp. Silwood1]CAF1605693.1 unnamed protein product [Rotaria sp. Silwood1]